MTSQQFWWQLGAFSGAAAVALGAFGAHALKNHVPPNLIDTWNTASHYHLVHTVALLIASRTLHTPNWSARLFTSGILLFSGSLYAYVLTQNKKFAAVTPIGGTAFIAGWIALGLNM